MADTFQRLLTNREAAALLNVAPQTMRRWRTHGAGPPFVKISANRVAYRLQAVQEWAAAREFESTADESAATALRRVSITS